ncbi:MAG: histidine kinase, dimerization and phosphoacceptor region [Pseudonocardiales bacterium]|nr:histidine kinase, dimerization and phosphoacceptor region [Pseudonocardiales bacterium]
MRTGLVERVERYAPTVLAALFALGAVIEDLISPMVTIGGRRYDRAPEAVVVIALCSAVALVALGRRLGVIGPLSALAAVGLAAIPAPAWLLNSALVFLLAMFVCGFSGYLAVGRVGLLGLGVVWLVASLAEWRNPERSAANWVSVGAFMSIAWCVGLLARRPVIQARSAEERAIRFEQEQDESARRAVTEERQRIARELHDIIAHSVSVMTMQTGAVRRLLLPAQVRERESLLSVEQTGRDAMSEMRRLVGLLKEEDSAAAYSPQPGMQSLDALIATVREAGLPVDVAFEGEPQELPPGVDLTAFRVVQEALTNARKHADPSRAWVRIRWAVDELRIEIGNDGHSRPQGPHAGFGHAGMRERLGLYGGRLENGPGTDGGYVVRAYLPVRTET